MVEVARTVLSRQEYCIITDPVNSKGRNQLGKRELRKGVTSFFLRPGELDFLKKHYKGLRQKKSKHLRKLKKSCPEREDILNLILH